VLGFGFGGALLGWLSDVLAANATGGGVLPDVAAATGLRGAMTVMSAFFVWAAVHFVLASRTIRKDLVV
jgi:hypothetical protein